MKKVPITLRASILAFLVLWSTSLRGQEAIAGRDTIDDLIVERYALAKAHGGFEYYFQRWPRGEIPYQFHPQVSSTVRSRFESACREWEAAAPITFALRDTQPTYVHVIAGRQNFAYLGYGYGARELMLEKYASVQTCLHELGHVIGLKHEHQRPDRDRYIQVHRTRIVEHAKPYFDPSPQFLYTSYDFSSIMHYSPYAFSKNGMAVIEPRKGYEKVSVQMGAGCCLSDGDREAVRRMYSNAPTLNLPKDALLFDLGNRKTVEWSSVDSAIGYHLQLAFTSSFGTPVIDTTTASGWKTSRVRFIESDSLPVRADTPLFVRVRALFAGGNEGPWSDTGHIGYRLNPSRLYGFNLTPLPENAERVELRLARPGRAEYMLFTLHGRLVDRKNWVFLSPGDHWVRNLSRDIGSGWYLHRLTVGPARAFGSTLTRH